MTTSPSLVLCSWTLEAKFKVAMATNCGWGITYNIMKQTHSPRGFFITSSPQAIMHLSKYSPTYPPAGVWRGLSRDSPKNVPLMTRFHPLVLPDCRGSSYCEANPYVSPYTIDGTGWSFTFVICPRGEAISSNVGKSPPVPNICRREWVGQYIDRCIISVQI